MKRLKVRLVLIFLLFAAALIVALLPSFKSVARAESDPVEDYAYSNGSMQIDIDENKVLHIKENLNVAFLHSQTYFERRVAGKAKSVKNDGGKLKNGRSFIAEIRAVGAKIDGEDCAFSVARNGTNNYLRLEKDGSFKKWNTDDRPLYNIELEYICDLSQDEDGKSALGFYFFEEVRQRWFEFDDGRLSRLSVTVNMPKEFDANSVYLVSTGGDVMATKLSFEGKSVSFAVEYKNIADCRLTALLPDGYFATRAHYFTVYWYFVGAVGVLALAGVIITVVFRKRRPVAPVEIAPPVLNTMLFSAHWHGIARRKDLCTVLLQWARGGYIKIKKDGKRDIIITKIKNLPKKYPAGEIAYFNAMFDGEKTYSSKVIRDEAAGRRRKRKIMFATGKLIEEIGEPVTYARGVLVGRAAVMFLSLLAPILCFLYCTLISRDYPFMAVTVFMVAFVAATFFAVYKSLSMIRVQRRAYSAVYRWILLLATPVFIPVTVLVWIMLTAQYMILYDYIYLLFISLAWIAVSLYVLPRFVAKRSEESQKIYGRMVGFKNFLRLVSVKEMEVMLDENPDYYLDVLPYCMIMGLSHKLDKKTEFLQAPGWAEGFDPKRFASSLFSTVRHSVITRKSKKEN